ncbi:alpha-N-arabinofuranosidase [Roseiflexus sp. RS-1]|jgi:alpha-N-arabinofuranosidase|uniref:alpha-N-arabinofuranosidase n=1 Tax=Roseiflexus sp. (strain RS-1) TaxID=357808 RepID=UPI0000D80E85|nr:alpha-N-arabinofuranosidase [Roseiflexus sp. RS-1]ABQ91872.1 Alpha-N-arabinofuranosidase [Roseiflexus sp. RS-1]
MNAGRSARIAIDEERVIGRISPLLFGGFIEHMGRCVYRGIFDPGSALADEHGLRIDVVAALRELNPRIIRYPGGNFLSGYHWRDGVGPVAQRPRRRELAWQSIETNHFGTHEFITLCRMLGAEPMLGVNLGTGTIEEAGAYVEYCNAPAGTLEADRRVANGAPEPFGVRYWCLGNEMDGPWQIGHMDATAYAVKAREAAKLMKWHDPSIRLTLCGSSSSHMPTYPEWDRIALEICWEYVDYLSLHFYAGNRDDDTDSYLALARQFEDHLDALAGTLRYVKAKLRSRHDVYLSWDEWNVWYKDQTMQGGWQEAPHLIEEVYNLEDALVVAQWLNVFLRRCDVLKMACLAQLVNVIAPILTRPDGILRQSIFYPFALFSRYASGDSLDLLVQAPTYATRMFGEQPLIDAAASYDAGQGKGAIFIVHRGRTEPLTLDLEWQGRAPYRVASIYQVSGSDPKAANTFDTPDVIGIRPLPGAPVVDGRFRLQVPPLSLTVAVVER